MIALIPKSKWGRLRFGIMLGVLLAIITYFFIVPLYWYVLYDPQDGDIIFQSLPKNAVVIAIEGATDSPYSHCGVVVNRNGKWHVNEAIGPVKDTSLYKWIVRGRRRKFAVYRLRSDYHRYIPKFIGELDKYQGRPYDILYELDDEYIYCSELIYKAFRDSSGIELGKLVELGELDWEPFTEIIEEIEGGKPPLDRLMITPRHLSEAKELRKIFSNGI